MGKVLCFSAQPWSSWPVPCSAAPAAWHCLRAKRGQIMKFKQERHIVKLNCHLHCPNVLNSLYIKNETAETIALPTWITTPNFGSHLSQLIAQYAMFKHKYLRVVLAIGRFCVHEHSVRSWISPNERFVFLKLAIQMQYCATY